MLRYLFALVGVVAALVFITAAAAMNWMFVASLGRSHAEGQILGAVSVAADIFKAVIPFFVTLALAARRYVFVAFASLLFCVFLSWSFVSALGFSAMSRGAVVGSKDALASRLAVVVADHGRESARLAALGEVRPVATIEAELAALRQDRRWRSSKECSDATAPASREFCEGYFRTKGGLGAAIEAERLREAVGKLAGERTALERAGAGVESDPQASLIARLTGFDVKQIQSGWVVFVALVVELGAAFGLWLALGHGFGRPSAPKVAPVAIVPRGGEVIDITPAPVAPLGPGRRRVVLAESQRRLAGAG